MVVEELSLEMRQKVWAMIDIINLNNNLVGLVVCSDGQYMVTDGLGWSVKHQDYLLCLDMALLVISRPTTYKEEIEKILKNNPARNPIPRVSLMRGQKWT